MSKEKAKKNDSLKLRLDLIPPEVQEALGLVLTFGSMKYEDNNWQNGLEIERIYGALERHLLVWREFPALRDNESDLPHIFHALCNVAFLVWYYYQKQDVSIGQFDVSYFIDKWKKALEKDNEE